MKREFKLIRQVVYQLVEVVPVQDRLPLTIPYGLPGTRAEAMALQVAIEKEREVRWGFTSRPVGPAEASAAFEASECNDRRRRT